MRAGLSVPSLAARLVDDLDAPPLPEVWDRLLAQSDSNVAFLTHHWLSAWWRSFGRGRPRIVLIERDGVPVTIAPLLRLEDRMYFIGSTFDSDYLDLIGEVGSATVELVIRTVLDNEPRLEGLSLLRVPAWSRTGGALVEVARRLNLDCRVEEEHVSPALELDPAGEAARAGAAKKSLVRHERALHRDGRVVVEHLRLGTQIAAHLEELFSLHIARWSATEQPYPSCFLQQSYRDFYRRLTQGPDDIDWLRLTRIVWEGRTVAIHFGSCYAGRYFWYKPAFAIDLARRSPGEVLLRHMLLAAADEGACIFDFGLGDEAFKLRFATHIERVRSWALNVGTPRSERGSASRSPAGQVLAQEADDARPCRGARRGVRLPAATEGVDQPVGGVHDRLSGGGETGRPNDCVPGAAEDEVLAGGAATAVGETAHHHVAHEARGPHEVVLTGHEEQRSARALHGDGRRRDGRAGVPKSPLEEAAEDDGGRGEVLARDPFGRGERQRLPAPRPGRAWPVFEGIESRPDDAAR